MSKIFRETIHAQGHRNVTARHKTTLEFTKDEHLTPRGDCIIAIKSDRGLQEFSEEFKSAMRDDNAELEITIDCGGLIERVKARGDSNLILTHPMDMVIRKGDFICDRTIGVKANKVAIDLDRNLIERLKQGNEIIIQFKITKSKY